MDVAEDPPQFIPAANVVENLQASFFACEGTHFTMQLDVRQGVAAVLTIGMFVALLDLMIHGYDTPSMPSQEIRIQVLSAGNDLVEERSNKISASSFVGAKTPKRLWGLPGPVLQPCWRNHIAEKPKNSKGYVLVKLSNGPLFHPVQVADAVIIARYLGATLVLPKIKEAAKDSNDGFSKIYDIDNFVASLKDVVRIVARLPEVLGSVYPANVKVPYKVRPEYIHDTVQPVFNKKRLIQITSIFSAADPMLKDDSTEEMQAIRCLVTYSALQFHRRVTELGEQVVSSMREASDNNRFIAIDLRVNLLNQTGCRQPEYSDSKKCFDASDVGNFLKSLGFSSSVPIYLTQPRWHHSLDSLKDLYPKVSTKEHSLTLEEDQQRGTSQLEKAIDFYVCTQSDVFVPAISGISYVNIAGMRIATGRTQILVPTVVDDDSSSRLQIPRVLSRFVTKKDHAVYSCFCKSSGMASKSKNKGL